MERPSCIKLFQFQGHRDCIYALLAAGDGKTFFSAGGDGMIVRWSLDHPDQGTQVAQLNGSIYSMALDPTKELLVAGRNHDGLHAIDLRSGSSAGSVHTGSTAIFDIAFNKGSILTANGDGRLLRISPHRWSIDEVLPLSDKSLRCIALDPQTGSVAVGSSDYRIRILDANTLTVRQEWQAHANSVFTLAYGIGDRILYSGARDARINTWDMRIDPPAGKETAGHLFAVNHIAFRGDGKHFLTCSMDKTIKVWTSGIEPKLQRVLDRARYAGHGNSVNRLCWINEEIFASAGDDRMISIWKFLSV
ncbi:MAG: WD40 repeat domain-containing protein [Bacteroidota bacterium]